jgi:hypothetical protein
MPEPRSACVSGHPRLDQFNRMVQAPASSPYSMSGTVDLGLLDNGLLRRGLLWQLLLRFCQEILQFIRICTLG